MVSRSSFQQALGSHWFDLHTSLQKITMKIVLVDVLFAIKFFFLVEMSIKMKNYLKEN